MTDGPAAGARDRRSGPLGHLRILDFTQFLAGPFGTLILADLGAEVIKVEPPQGDSSRSVPPHQVAGSSTYFTGINRNKYSVVIDLRSEEGRRLAADLAARSDVVMENYRPGVMDRLGLGYEALSLDNPGLVWCSISGFGQDGPDLDRPAYDMIVQALSGVMSLTGERGGRPVRAGVPIGDIAAGMYGAIGVLAALQERDRTGRGRAIDISMLDGQVSFLCYQAAAYFASGVVPGPQGRGHDFIPTYRTFAASDGIEVAITANTERMWQGLCRTLGLEALADDPRFATATARNANREALTPELEAAFRARPAEEWVALLREAGVPVATVNTLDRALAEPQVRHRNMVLELEGAAPDQRARVVGNPIKIDGVADGGDRFPPPLGADTRLVLERVLGLDAPEIDRLMESGAVA